MAVISAGVTVTDREPAQVIAQLRELGIRRAWLVGGGELAGSFREVGLVDEYL